MLGTPAPPAALVGVTPPRPASDVVDVELDVVGVVVVVVVLDVVDVVEVVEVVGGVRQSGRSPSKGSESTSSPEVVVPPCTMLPVA